MPGFFNAQEGQKSSHSAGIISAPIYNTTKEKRRENCRDAIREKSPAPHDCRIFYALQKVKNRRIAARLYACRENIPRRENGATIAAGHHHPPRFTTLKHKSPHHFTTLKRKALPPSRLLARARGKFRKRYDCFRSFVVFYFFIFSFFRFSYYRFAVYFFIFIFLFFSN